MRQILCKIWNFVLMLFGDVVDVVLEAIDDVANLAIDVISLVGDELVDIIDKVAESTGLGSVGKIVLWGGLAYVAYIFLSKDQEDKADVSQVT